MKKFIMFIFILWPSLIGAQSIDNYYLNITIQASGDTLVENIIDSKETLDYLETNLPLKDNLTLETVGSIKKNKTYDFTSLGVKEFLKTNKATTNDTNLYLLIPRSNDTTLRIYNSANQAYYFKYLLKDKVLLYDDKALLELNIPKTNYEIKNFHITINIPKKDKVLVITSKDKKNFKSDKISLEYHHLKEDISLKAIFNKDLVSLSSNNIQGNILDTLKISNLTYDIFFSILSIFVSLLSLIFLGILNYLKIKISKEKKNNDFKRIINISLVIIIFSSFLIRSKILYTLIFLGNIIIYSKTYQKKKNSYLLSSYFFLNIITYLNILGMESILNALVFLLSSLSLGIFKNTQREELPALDFDATLSK